MATAAFLTSRIVVRGTTIRCSCFVVSRFYFAVCGSRYGHGHGGVFHFAVRGSRYGGVFYFAVRGSQYGAYVSLFHVLQSVLRTPALCPCGSWFLVLTSYFVVSSSSLRQILSIFTSCRCHFLSSCSHRPFLRKLRACVACLKEFFGLELWRSLRRPELEP